MPKASSLFSISRLATLVTAASTATMLLLVLPFTEDFVSDSKIYLLFFWAIISGILFAFSIMRRGAIELVLSKTLLWTGLLLVAVVASTFFTSPYPVKALLSLGGMFIAVLSLVLFLSGLLASHDKKIWFNTLLTSLIILVLVTGLEFVQMGVSKVLPLFGPFEVRVPGQFNLAGSVLVALQAAMVALVGLVTCWVTSKKATAFQLVAFAVLLVAGGLFTWNILQRNTADQLPSWSASWSVALDSVRDPRSALIGVGTGSYTNAYQAFKPVWLNSTPRWNTIYSSAVNVPLTLLTTTGFLGLIAWAGLFLTVIFKAKKTTKDELPFLTMLITTFAISLVLPPNPVLLTIQAALLAYHIAAQRLPAGVLHFNFFHAKVYKANDLSAPRRQSKWPAYLTGIIVLALLAVAAFFLTRYYLAGFYMLQGTKAALADDALGLYNNQQTAYQLNEYADSYRRRYALTSLTLAELLAQKTDKTKEDEQTIAQLIQQAVREGRNAASLDPLDAQNALTLGTIYQRLIGGIEGAETFAIQELVQGIALFPTAPDPYISLAGVYFRQKNFEQALSVLNQGASIKGDYPNTFFNMGYAFEQLGSFANAKAAYERAQSLLADQNTPEYVELTNKIAELQKKVDEQAKQQSKQGTAGQGQAANDQPTALDMTLKQNQQPAETPATEDVQLPADSALPSSTPTPNAITTPAAIPPASPATSPAP